MDDDLKKKSAIKEPNQNTDDQPYTAVYADPSKKFKKNLSKSIQKLNDLSEIHESRHEILSDPDQSGDMVFPSQSKSFKQKS